MQRNTPTSHRETRSVVSLSIVTVVAVLTLAAALIPSPYSIERPGPVLNTLGDIAIEGEDVPVISISDVDTFETNGTLNLLTVSIAGSPDHPASWLSLLPGVFDASQRIAPRSEFYPEGITDEERTEATTVQMDSSQVQATAAAFKQLGIDVPAELGVGTVMEHGPAEGVLESGDVLLAIDHTPLKNFSHLREVIAASGDNEITVTVVRDGVEKDVLLTPVVPEGGTAPMIGVTIASQYDFPADIDISVAAIGGASAGMVFGLALYDMMTPEPLLDDLVVSGTGTLSEAGDVGRIGGLPQKMWAASRAGTELFLMPVLNCEDLPEKIPDNMTIAPVETLEEAISAIDTVNAGETPAGLERCSVRP